MKDGWALPENTEKVACVLAQTAAAIGPGAYIGMRNVRKMFAVVDFVYGADADCTITVLEAPLVDGVGAAAITKTLPMWASLDVVASSVIPEIAPAASYTFDAGAGKSQTLIIQIEGADLSSGNNAITINVGNSDVANIVAVNLYVIPREFKESLLVD